MNSEADVVVRRIPPFDGAEFRVVKSKNLSSLAENEVDKWRASRSDIITQSYNRALALQRGHIV